MATCDSEIGSSIELGYSNTHIPDENSLAEFDTWLKNNKDSERRLVIAVAGKSGMGKSTLINNFLGIDEAVNSLSPRAVTSKVGVYEHTVNGIPVCVIDVPGLHARGQTEEERQRIIVELSVLNEKEKVNMMLYCTSLVQKIDQTDDKIFETLNTAFGKEIWNHTVFVLTWADVVATNDLNSLVSSFKTEIEDVLTVSGVKLDNPGFEGVSTVITSKIPMLPPDWRTKLLSQIIKTCNEKDMASFLQVQGITGDYIKRCLITAGLGGAAGILAGAASGAASGAKFGVVAGVPGATAGAIVGGVVGGVVASPTAVAVVELYNNINTRLKLNKLKTQIQKENQQKKKDN